MEQQWQDGLDANISDIEEEEKEKDKEIERDEREENGNRKQWRRTVKDFSGHQCLILQRGSAGTTAHSMSLSDKQDEVTSHHMFITVVVTSSNI